MLQCSSNLTIFLIFSYTKYYLLLIIKPANMIKSLVSETFLRRLVSTAKYQFSTAAQVQPESRRQSFRTNEKNPQNHTLEHLGQFYTIPQNEKSIFAYGGLPKTFEIQTKTFNETSIMIRKPSLDIINCLKAIDYNQPAVRFVVFGKKGSGKSLSLAHVLHYGHKTGFLLVHVPWVGNWLRRPRECSLSETREGFMDLNLDAAGWLLHFKSQNEDLLKNPDLKLGKDYSWSKRETTPAGAPITELIDHGINRIKYASDCIVYLAEELKRLSREGLCKSLVVIDGFNAFFYPQSRVFGEKKIVIHPHKVTLTEGFLNLTKFDWNNSAIIVTVDELAIAEEDHKSHLPRYLLGKEGFHHLDPFVPVPVENYTEKELKSCMDYYRERKWVQEVANQDEELAFVSGSNPYKLMQLCAAI